MTPKEKAEEMIYKFSSFSYDGASSSEENAIECALIAVDEILEVNPMYPRQSRPMKRSNGTDMVMTDYPAFLYWHEVKTELTTYQP